MKNKIKKGEFKIELAITELIVENDEGDRGYCSYPEATEAMHIDPKRNGYYYYHAYELSENHISFLVEEAKKDLIKRKAQKMARNMRLDQLKSVAYRLANPRK